MMPWWSRVLMRLFQGPGADVIRGDIEEHFRRNGNRRRLFSDLVSSLANWWRPSAMARRRRARRPVYVRKVPGLLATMFTFLSDVRITLRSLSRRPAYAAVVLATIGLGIGATTTIFSVVDAVVVRPLPYEDADRLVAVGNTFPGREWADERGNIQHLAGVSLPNFLDWRTRSTTLSTLVAAERTSSLLPDEGDGPELVPMARITEGWFDAFGVAPVLGRSFLPEDHAGLNGPVTMVSYATWQNRFGGDPEVVGTVARALGAGYTIVGVLPPDFGQPSGLGTDRIEFWDPLDAQHPRYESRGRRSLAVYGRLASGASVASARAEIDAIQAQLAVEYPDGNVYPNGDRLGAGVNDLHSETVGTSRYALFVFLGASGLLLLIAILNAANLLLVRGLDRGGELGIRQALGAGRFRLTSVLLTESVLLAVGGGALGIGLAYGGVEVFRGLAPQSLPRLNEVAVDGRVVMICAAASVAVGVLVGMLPAWRLTGMNVSQSIRQRIGTTVPGGNRSRTVLVTTQLAFAVVLVVGASLLFNSFLRVTRVDPGFNPRGLTTFSLPMKRPGAPEGERMWQAWDGLLAEVRAVPGVTSVAATSVLPFASPQWAPWILLPGEPMDHRREGVAGYVVTPDFFSAAEIPLLEGRGFSDADGPDGFPVAVVNQAFVDQHFSGREPLALPLRIREGDDGVRELQVVGVVGNVVQTRAEDGPRPAVYVPYTQSEWPSANVVVRSDRDLETLATDLRRAAARFSSFVPVRNLQAMTTRIHTVRTGPRFQAVLLGSFAAVALLLAVIGLYGALQHVVGRRTREMGIRMALGAPRASIFRLVLSQGLVVTAAGLALGIGGAVYLTRFLQQFLFEVQALDVLSFAAGAVLLTLAAVAAIIVPARRASGVDVVGNLKAD